MKKHPTTEAIPSEVREALAEALDEMTRDEVDGAVDAFDLLDMTEDDMIDAFGSDLTDLLASLTFYVATEWVEVSRPTFDDPGDTQLLGSVSIMRGNSEVARGDVTEDGLSLYCWND